MGRYQKQERVFKLEAAKCRIRCRCGQRVEKDEKYYVARYKNGSIIKKLCVKCVDKLRGFYGIGTSTPNETIRPHT